MHLSFEDKLKNIFSENYTYCTEWLMRKMNCPQFEAEDIFMDAIIKLNVEMQEGKFVATNVQGWLVMVMRNQYINRFNKKKKYTFLQVDSVEGFIGRQEGLYSDEFDPITKAEAAKTLAQEEEWKVISYKEGFEKLGESCQKLLAAIAQGLRLKDLQEPLGYGTYDSIKSTSARCKKTLKRHALTIFQHLKDDYHG